jgi:hypothetical protein
MREEYHEKPDFQCSLHTRTAYLQHSNQTHYKYVYLQGHVNVFSTQHFVFLTLNAMNKLEEINLWRILYLLLAYEHALPICELFRVLFCLLSFNIHIQLSSFSVIFLRLQHLLLGG